MSYLIYVAMIISDLEWYNRSFETFVFHLAASQFLFCIPIFAPSPNHQAVCRFVIHPQQGFSVASLMMNFIPW